MSEIAALRAVHRLADENGIAFSRSAGQVLNIVYLNPASVSEGGFFPNGVNGEITTSDDNS